MLNPRIVCSVMIMPLKMVDHLFFSCPFSQSFWWKLGFDCGTPISILLTCSYQLVRISCIILVLRRLLFWDVGASLWNHSNNIIFHAAFFMFQNYFTDVRHRAKPSLKEGMQFLYSYTALYIYPSFIII
ncbi:hypothetical protein BRADI_2g36779v3 [Brachypodium distachyon]|uniref:Reverse transcriptase zinc-binding domain-containing protein n=1 Tax=Brachypodium distachyon TaxID=15368 RepID=A0A2K2DC72_BRADI|nr:hypothetical protein BRADI_2g36779v3 [Brachypodium distachyon]